VKKAATPRLLVVVTLPKDPLETFHATQEQLVLRRCGYWLNLLGEPPTSNATSETVHVPRRQVFDPHTLQRLMALASRLEVLR
jgi:hypothetical protein